MLQLNSKTNQLNYRCLALEHVKNDTKTLTNANKNAKNTSKIFEIYRSDTTQLFEAFCHQKNLNLFEKFQYLRRNHYLFTQIPDAKAQNPIPTLRPKIQYHLQDGLLPCTRSSSIQSGPKEALHPNPWPSDLRGLSNPQARVPRVVVQHRRRLRMVRRPRVEPFNRRRSVAP